MQTIRDDLSLSRLTEMRIKDERIKALALQLCEKEQQLQPPTEATKEELEHGYKQQLKESRVSYDQLRESSCWCGIKLLREEVNELQGANRVKDEEISTLKNICQLSCIPLESFAMDHGSINLHAKYC